MSGEHLTQPTFSARKTESVNVTDHPSGADDLPGADAPETSFSSKKSNPASPAESNNERTTSSLAPNAAASMGSRGKKRRGGRRLNPRAGEKADKGDESAERDDVWETEGSEYLGRRIMRTILDSDGSDKGFATGSVIGWLRAEHSDFCNEETGEPAALWRVHYDEVFEHDGDSGDLVRFHPDEMGTEDFEEHELVESVAMYKKHPVRVRSWYKTRVDGENSTSIGKKLQVDPDELVNETKEIFPAVTRSSKFKLGTWLLVPRAIPYIQILQQNQLRKEERERQQEALRLIQEEEELNMANRKGIMDLAEQRDSHGIFVYEPEAHNYQHPDGQKRVRFANLLEHVVAEVEKVAESTDGRWTRGLHKRTSDTVAANHVADTKSNATGERLKPILRPFELFQTEQSVQEAFIRAKADIKKSVACGKEYHALSNARVEHAKHIPCEACQSSDNGDRMVVCDICDLAWHFDCLSPKIQSAPAADWVCPKCQDILDKKCFVCHSKAAGEKMILCDGCNAGIHIYCLDPPLKSVPKEDWYCSTCTRARAQKSEMAEQACTVCRKRDRMDQIVSCSGCDDAVHIDCLNPPLDKVPQGDWVCTHCTMEETACVVCKSKEWEDMMILCDGCDQGVHIDCLDPPLDKVPDGDWFCAKCSAEKTACVVCNSKHQEGKIILCHQCDQGYHIHCLDPPLKRVPKSQWFCVECDKNQERGAGSEWRGKEPVKQANMHTKESLTRAISPPPLEPLKRGRGRPKGSTKAAKSSREAATKPGESVGGEEAVPDEFTLVDVDVADGETSSTGRNRRGGARQELSALQRARAALRSSKTGAARPIDTSEFDFYKDAIPPERFGASAHESAKTGTSDASVTGEDKVFAEAVQESSSVRSSGEKHPKPRVSDSSSGAGGEPTTEGDGDDDDIDAVRKTSQDGKKRGNAGEDDDERPTTDELDTSQSLASATSALSASKKIAKHNKNHDHDEASEDPDVLLPGAAGAPSTSGTNKPANVLPKDPPNSTPGVEEISDAHDKTESRSDRVSQQEDEVHTLQDAIFERLLRQDRERNNASVHNPTTDVMQDDECTIHNAEDSRDFHEETSVRSGVRDTFIATRTSADKAQDNTEWHLDTPDKHTTQDTLEEGVKVQASTVLLVQEAARTEQAEEANERVPGSRDSSRDRVVGELLRTQGLMGVSAAEALVSDVPFGVPGAGSLLQKRPSQESVETEADCNMEEEEKLLRTVGSMCVSAAEAYDNDVVLDAASSAGLVRRRAVGEVEELLTTPGSMGVSAADMGHKVVLGGVDAGNLMRKRAVERGELLRSPRSMGVSAADVHGKDVALSTKQMGTLMQRRKLNAHPQAHTDVTVHNLNDDSFETSERQPPMSTGKRSAQGKSASHKQHSFSELDDDERTNSRSDDAGVQSPLKRFRAALEDDARGNQDGKVPSKHEWPDQVCNVCGKVDREDKMLLCDGCDDGVHIDCLTQPLEVIPDGDWFCGKCRANNASNKDIADKPPAPKRGRGRPRKSDGAVTADHDRDVERNAKEALTERSPAGASTPSGKGVKSGSHVVGEGGDASRRDSHDLSDKKKNGVRASPTTDAFTAQPDDDGDARKSKRVRVQTTHYTDEDFCAHRRRSDPTTHASTASPDGDDDDAGKSKRVRASPTTHASKALPDDDGDAGKNKRVRVQTAHYTDEDFCAALADKPKSRGRSGKVVKSEGIVLNVEGFDPACFVCGKKDREDKMILCDGCNDGTHIDCLSPPLDRVPEDDWFCAKCCDRSGASQQDERDSPTTAMFMSLPDDVDASTYDDARSSKGKRPRKSPQHASKSTKPKYPDVLAGSKAATESRDQREPSIRSVSQDAAEASFQADGMPRAGGKQSGALASSSKKSAASPAKTKAKATEDQKYNMKALATSMADFFSMLPLVGSKSKKSEAPRKK